MKQRLIKKKCSSVIGMFILIMAIIVSIFNIRIAGYMSNNVANASVQVDTIDNENFNEIENMPTRTFDGTVSEIETELLSDKKTQESTTLSTDEKSVFNDLPIEEISEEHEVEKVIQTKDESDITYNAEWIEPEDNINEFSSESELNNYFGYTKGIVNVRATPNGEVLGKYPIGQEISGYLEDGWVKINYNEQIGYIWSGVLQTEPVTINGYILGGTNIRFYAGGPVYKYLDFPIYIVGTISENWVEFTLDGSSFVVHRSRLTSTAPRVYGYLMGYTNVRESPNGEIYKQLPIGTYISGVMERNWVKITLDSKYYYVYGSLIQKAPIRQNGYTIGQVNVRNYNNINQIIGKLEKGRQVSGRVIGNYITFDRNGITAAVHRSQISSNPIIYNGYVLAGSNVRNVPNGTIIGRYDFTYDIKGIWQGNWLKIEYKNQTGYVYSSRITSLRPSSYIPYKYRPAIESAKQWLEYGCYSKQELYEILIQYDEFTPEEAHYAVNNIGINWTQEAIKCAKEWLSYNAYSKQRLYEILMEIEKFTSSEAWYAANNSGVNYTQEAIRSAKEWLGYDGYSKQRLYEILMEIEKFTSSEAWYAANNSGANYYQEALECAQSWMKYYSYSQNRLYEILTDIEKFTPSEAQYALNILFN